jgi:hypothetical protein
MPTDGFWPRLKRWLANGVIVVIVVMVLCDAMPFAPDRWQAAVVPIVNRLGIGQGRWTMFAPPDGANHRLRAELTLRDGRVLHWHAPDLTQQSVWQRFVGHRRSEYVDNAIVFGKQYPETWEVFADRLMRQYEEQGHDVVRVRVIVELANLPPPSGSVWPPRSKELPFDDQQVVIRRKYP